MIGLQPAAAEDAAEIAALLRRSITELCVADHRSDPTEIAAWTANKTTDTVRGWIADDRLALITATSDGALAGVGAVDAGGCIHLLYVHPEHRYEGISDALLAHMVAAHDASRLTSTFTAREFYRNRGWQETGVTAPDGVPMRFVRAD